MSVSPFEFVTAINSTKENLFETKGYTDSDYNRFIVNRALSYFNDTVFYANESNRIMQNIPAQAHFNFLRLGVEKRKRFAKWGKAFSSENVSLIMRYYNYSQEKALEIMPLLNSSDIEKIKQSLSTGGV